MNKKRILDKSVTFGFYIAILLFFTAYKFQDSRNIGWYQQFLPTGIPNFQVSDVFFLDSLTGWIVSGNTNPNDSSGFILKTSNGGNNWIVQFGEVRDFTRVEFLNSNTGFVCGGYSNGARLYKTINGGTNWFALNIPGSQIIFDDMSVLNEDTIWLAARESLVGGVFRTTNGGISWTQQFSAGTENPNKIYMYNARIGFIANSINNSGIRKTSDGGNSWLMVLNNEYFDKMYFADSLVGWKCSSLGIKKTTDGGLNWVPKPLPSGGGISSLYNNFSNINKDTIWAIGGYVIFPNNQIKQLAFRSTNGGNNWYYQIPDTSVNTWQYWFINFADKLKGWIDPSNYNKELHTITGGDSTFLSSIHQISNEVPKGYKLFQNYPNPFNSMTNVKFQMLKQGFAEIKIFDISGKLIKIIFSENIHSGLYETKFDASELSSGVYFYTLFVDGAIIDTKKMILLK